MGKQIKVGEQIEDGQEGEKEAWRGEDMGVARRRKRRNSAGMEIEGKVLEGVFRGKLFMQVLTSLHCSTKFSQGKAARAEKEREVKTGADKGTLVGGWEGNREAGKGKGFFFREGKEKIVWVGEMSLCAPHVYTR